MSARFIGHPCYAACSDTLDESAADYKWIDAGKVLCSVPGRDNWNAIDPCVFVSDADHWYLLFGSFWDGIKMTAIDPKTGMAESDPPVVTSLARRPGVPNDPIEAPDLFEKDGYYYLFASFDYCCRGMSSDYHVVVGRSRSIEGPYLDRQGVSMLSGGGTTILQSHGDVHGPGHSRVLRDGDKEYLVHHMYDGKRNGLPVLQVRPLSWSEDGWPVVGEPIAQVVNGSSADSSSAPPRSPPAGLRR